MIEWIWVITTLSILFLFLVVFRIGYMVGYRKGAKRVIAEWKLTLEEENDNE